MIEYPLQLMLDKMASVSLAAPRLKFIPELQSTNTAQPCIASREYEKMNTKERDALNMGLLERMSHQIFRGKFETAACSCRILMDV